MKNKERIANFEILRTVAMLMIVTMHVFIDSGVMGSSIKNSSGMAVANYAISELINTVIYVGVNCFILITGYFLIDRYTFSLIRVERIWAQTCFYLFMISLVCYITGACNTSVTELMDSLLVIRGNKNWFVKCYIGLIMIAPFLSIAVHNLSKRQYQLLLCVGTLISVNLFKPLCFPYGDLYDCYGGATLAWFVYLYIVAGYIRLYNPLTSKKRVGMFFLLCWMTMVIEYAVKIYSEYQKTGCMTFVNIGSYNGVLMPMAVLIFVYFKNAQFKSRVWKPFVAIAPYVFGVFLLHEHFKLKELIWAVLSPDKYIYSPWFLAYVLLCVVVIFAVGITVDWVRNMIVAKLHLVERTESANNKIKVRIKRMLRM
jgi:surface polysaccharide O-acyltransferase-like enzyme